VDILFCPYCGTSSPAVSRSRSRCSSCENTFIVRKTSSN
jgi:hypothetical protein